MVLTLNHTSGHRLLYLGYFGLQQLKSFCQKFESLYQQLAYWLQFEETVNMHKPSWERAEKTFELTKVQNLKRNYGHCYDISQSGGQSISYCQENIP